LTGHKVQAELEAAENLPLGHAIGSKVGAVGQ